MEKKERRFLSADGKTPIHVVEWLPDVPPRGVVQLAHGIAEYADRYHPFASFLAEQGFVVVAGDHIGHGQSLADGAPRLYFGPAGSWDWVVQDLYTLRCQTGEAWPELPYFLLGHSMGSFLSRSYLLRYPGTLSGAVLMGTGQPSALLLSGGRLLLAEEIRRVGEESSSALAQKAAFGSYNKVFAPNRTAYDWLSVDPDNVDRYLADPLCGGDPSTGLLRELLTALGRIGNPRAWKRMNLNTPILFISGGMDPVGDCGRAVRRLADGFRRAGVRSVDLWLYPEARHEILNDLCKEQVYADLLAWFNDHLPA